MVRPRRLRSACPTYLKVALEHLRRVKLGSAALEFCLYMHRRTFGDAGYHRRNGRVETACEFDLARWAAEIPNDKSNVRRIRTELEGCHIITFVEDTGAPGRGVIAWNTAYDEWRPYEKRRISRHKQAGMVISTEQSAVVTSSKQGNMTMLDGYQITTPAHPKQPCLPAESGVKITTVGSLNGGKITTLGSLEGPAEAARDGALRKDTEERDTKKEEPDAVASGSGAGATALSPAAPVREIIEKKPTKRSYERKLTDEQLEAHQAEQQWCREVLNELARRLDVKAVPRTGQQKAAAKWLYGELRGVEDGQRRLWQCYDLTKRDPFWQGKTLLLSDLIRPFPEYRRDPVGYRAAIERAALRASQRSQERDQHGQSGSGTYRRGAVAHGHHRYGGYAYSGGNGYERPGGPKFGTAEYYEDGRRRMAEEAARANAGLAG